MPRALSNDEFSRVLQESLNTWSSYLNTGSDDYILSRQAIDLKPLVNYTPPFLGDSVASFEEPTSFVCEEKGQTQGSRSLVINSRSTWRTSKGTCDLAPRVLSKQLLLGLDSRLSVKLSEDAPFSNWPGVQVFVSPLFCMGLYPICTLG